MLKDIAKGFLTVILVFVGGFLGILEIGIEVVYQTTRLIRRGFRYCYGKFLKKLEPIYNGKMKLELKRNGDKTETIKYYEFTYEE